MSYLKSIEVTTIWKYLLAIIALLLTCSCSRVAYTRCHSQNAASHPLRNFDALWERFNSRYALFRIRKVNWKKLRKKYRSRLDSCSTPKELYKVLHDMTSELRDYHVTLEVPEKIESSYSGNFEPSPYYWRSLRRSALHVARKVFKKFKSYSWGGMRWGVLPNTKGKIGYLQLNDLEYLFRCSSMRQLFPNMSCYWWVRYFQGPDMLMRVVRKDLRHTKTIILDLRFNTGGYDYAARKMLGYFVTKRTLAYSKRTKYSWGYGGWSYFYIKPVANPLRVKLIILTSHVTASAAEVMAMSVMHLKHVTIIGTHTRGIFSDVYESKLPNGWKFTLSHQIYRDSKGKIYEGKGLPPDIKVPYPTKPKKFYRRITKDVRRKAGQSHARP